MPDLEETVRALSEMPRANLEVLRDAVSIAITHSDDQVSRALQGTPRDAAVQKLAAWALRMMRDETFRRQNARKLDAAGVMTYEEIGEHVAGVTRERVRGLYERLVN